MLGQAERLYELKELFWNDEKTQSSTGIIAFASGKGGTGKTFLSLNIAAELSRLNKKVLYIDFDFNLGNAHLLLNINPDSTLTDYLSGRSSLKDIVYKHNKNFHLVFGDSGKVNYPEIDGHVIENLINQVKLLDYNLVILDLPAGAGKEILTTISYTDYVILVANPEPTAIMDAYSLSKLIRYEGLECEQYAIINKCRNEDEGVKAFSNLNSASLHFLKKNIKLLSCIIYSNDVVESAHSQKLFTEFSDRSEAILQIKAVAKNLSEIPQLANIHQPLKKTS